MAKSSNYWKKRLENISDTQNKKADNYIESLEIQYKKAMASIQKDLESFYIRYGNAEGVDMATAKKILSNAEKEMWEVSLGEYREMALDEEFIDQIESMYTKSRVSRLKAIEMQIRAQLEVIYSDLNTELGVLLTDTFTDTYYQTVYEIQKGIGIGTNFAIFNENAVKKIVSKPWKWGHFSSTIWSNKDLLLGELETALSQAFIRGDSIDKVITTFAKKMDTGYKRAANVIQTEHAYIAGEATFKGYEETGVEKYEILATLDRKTSDICQDMDGKTFKLSEKVVWLNYPPLHCRCRSTTVPHFDDEEAYGQRVARDHEGNVYYVPEGMNFHEWYDKYVKGNPDALLAEKKHKNKYADKKQYENYKKVLGKEAPKTFNDFQELKYSDSKEWEEIKLKKSLVEQLDKLTDEEKAVITRYTGYLANNVNSALGAKKVEKIKKYANEIELLDSALAKGVIPEDIIVTRKTIVSNMNLPNGLDLMSSPLKRQKLHNTMFTSTTLKDFDYPGRDVYINFKIPKGYKGALYIKPLAYEKYKYQEEILFHRGLKYKINHVRIEENIYYVDAEVIQ